MPKHRNIPSTIPSHAIDSPNVSVELVSITCSKTKEIHDLISSAESSHSLDGELAECAFKKYCAQAMSALDQFQNGLSTHRDPTIPSTKQSPGPLKLEHKILAENAKKSLTTLTGKYAYELNQYDAEFETQANELMSLIKAMLPPKQTSQRYR